MTFLICFLATTIWHPWVKDGKSIFSHHHPAAQPLIQVHNLEHLSPSQFKQGKPQLIIANLGDPYWLLVLTILKNMKVNGKDYP